MKCTACGGMLEEGFLPDVGFAQTWVAVWIKGAPNTKKSVWERMRSGAGVSMEEAEARAVEAMRCTACGHLELFANKEPEKGTTLAR